MGGGAEQRPEFWEPVALAVDVHDRDVVQETVEDRRGQDLVPGKDLGPVPDVLFLHARSIKPRSVSRGDEPEEEVRLHAVERAKAQLVDDELGAV